MGLQTIIDTATYIEVDTREPSAGVISRSGKYKTSDTNINLYRFNIGMHDGLEYGSNRGLLTDLATATVSVSNVSLNNNSGQNFITEYKGNVPASGGTDNLTVSSTFGNQIYVDQTTMTSGSGLLFVQGDFIQPKGNTNTYKYPYQVLSNVTYDNTSSNTTITVHRPILNQNGVNIVGSGFRIGQDVRFNLQILDLPTHDIVPYNRIQFNGDFECIEVLT